MTPGVRWAAAAVAAAVAAGVAVGTAGSRSGQALPAPVPSPSSAAPAKASPAASATSVRATTAPTPSATASTATASSATVPSPAASSPAAAPVRARPAPPPVRNVASPGLDVTTVIGPPPGPRADRRPERTAAPADRWALLVGVQDYRPPTVDTVASARDVQLIAAQLRAAGWPAANIRVLTDAQVTGAAVREGLAWLAARSRPGTFALFHWSGHVKQLGGTTEALWPVDRDFVRDSEVTAGLAGARGRLWVDVAGCEAASFLAGLPSARTLFSGSSTATQKSYEQPAWGLSVWTGLLFDQGLRQGHADADGDGRTTVGESLRWAQWAAQGVTHGQRPHGRQTPQYAGADDLGWTLADPPA